MNKFAGHFCNNCGNIGHLSYQCNFPITSIGIIAFRVHPQTGQREYLLICRKDTLGYIDLIRGKYVPNNRTVVLHMFRQMTVAEKTRVMHYLHTDASTDLGFRLWRQLWTGTPKDSNAPVPKISHAPAKHSEEYCSKHNFTATAPLLDSVFAELEDDPMWTWNEPEWGFPKGRRDVQENDWTCAVREFREETGHMYSAKQLVPIHNLLPYEETFIGSNHKPYKHKYFVVNIKYEECATPFRSSEVSQVAWKTLPETLEAIRFYCYERRNMIQTIDRMLCSVSLVNCY